VDNTKGKRQHRVSRHKRVRAKIFGTAECPRVSVFKSNKHVFVQFVNDESGKTLLSNRIQKETGKRQKAQETKTGSATKLGEMLAEKAKEVGINEVVFDRGGFKYHGRIKAVADGLRKGGIKV